MPSGSKSRDIYIVGAQCTGKTTLVKALSKRDDSDGRDGPRIAPPGIITEVARGVLKQHSFIAEDIRSSPARAFALQQLILQAQASAERAVTGQADWFISDRSGADPIVYARRYVSEDAAEDLATSVEWLELRGKMGKSVVIVCEAGADWLTDDGVRLMPENREDWIWFHELFCSCLDKWGLRYQVLPCDMTNPRERLAFVLGSWGWQEIRTSSAEPRIGAENGRQAYSTPQ